MGGEREMVAVGKVCVMDSVVARQRDFFASGATKSFSFRAMMLRRLARAVSDREADILEALGRDLGRSRVAGYSTEIAPSLAEIRYARKNLRRWIKPRRVAGSRWFPLSRGSVVSEPLGVCLIISPWNYPFLLAMTPLVGAVAAGNCAILKPSEISSHTERVIAQLVSESFDPEYITVVAGGPDVSQALLRRRFDYIFFTGGQRVGRSVMQAAAEHTTPVTLELGGKSPCVVAEDCDMEKTARRITWGKFLNAGQTCVAPDYLLVHRTVKDELIARMTRCIEAFYGADPRESHDYGRIVSASHFERLQGLLQGHKVIFGGQADRESLYIAPTLVEAIGHGQRIMEEEIFGPILPILEFDRIAEAIALINQRPKPLALYLFSGRRDIQRQVIAETSSGGVCINDTVVHLTPPTLPFGGVGASGFGRYHGRAGFDTFSNQKSVLRQTLLFDLPKRFPPTRQEDLKVLRYMLR